MKSLLAVTIASSYGLTIRLLFGFFDTSMGIMSNAFLLLTPIIIGFLTVLFLPRKNVKSGVSAFFFPWLTCFAILIITMLLNIEGSICWIIIFPFFAILAGIGGLIGYQFKKNKPIESDNNDSVLDDNFKFALPLLLVLPVLIGFIEKDHTLTSDTYLIENQIEINASPEIVWNQILSISKIKKEEEPSTFSTILGFPKHINTTLDSLKIGGKRMAYYEKGLYFEETIIEYTENEKLVLAIHTDPDNIPPTVMDEHILIGGKHLDITEDIYTLKKLPNGNTLLSLSSNMYINTPFNWYASIWAKYLMSDILTEQLELIGSRSV